MQNLVVVGISWSGGGRDRNWNLQNKVPSGASGGGSGRTLQRSSQLWPTGMECSRMSSAELREGEKSLEFRDQRLELAYLEDPFYRCSLMVTAAAA